MPRWRAATVSPGLARFGLPQSHRKVGWTWGACRSLPPDLKPVWHDWFLNRAFRAGPLAPRLPLNPYAQAGMNKAFVKESDRDDEDDLPEGAGAAGRHAQLHDAARLRALAR